jgi:hypothetical protein
MTSMSIWDEAPKNSKESYGILKRCAAYMYTISYEDLAKEIGELRGDKGPAPVSLNQPLGFIRDKVCRPRGLPWLNALAVGKTSMIPGESFIPPGAVGTTTNPMDEFLWWRGMVLQVYAYPWDTLDLK